MTKQLLKLSTTITTMALTLALTACGGGGGSDGGTATAGTNTGGETPTSETTLANCAETNNDKGFASATDVTNKTLHKLTTDTTVHVWDISDGSKKACTEIGLVELI